MQLTQKEQIYLKDAKNHEELCIAKYNSYTQAVSCQQLKQVLAWAGQQENNHLNTINQLLQGQVPQMGNQQGGQQGGQQSGQSGQKGSMGQGGSITQMLSQMSGQSQQQGGSSQQQGGGSQQQSGNKGQSFTGSMMPGATASQTQFTGQGTLNDQQMCTDLLTTEKAVSDMYDHAVFESTNQQLRQVLNHIQKEEQDHAFAIYQYMQQKGWYQAQ